ncbi:MAG: hypothetical protein LBO72_04085 [Helicobacteraceae bacterium]|jgi:hypothetical protein|nr:hypothetical protein [Helicobacteraceae bacterium]
MRSICAVFEEWVMGDGNYPVLCKKDKVNLSFYIRAYDFEVKTNEKIYLFEQIKHAEYNFSGKVIYKLPDLIVVDTIEFKFYIETSDKTDISVGDFVKGRGQLAVDYFAWVENLREFKDPPNILYNLIVERIYVVKIPQRHIVISENAISCETSLSAEEFSQNDMQEAEQTNNSNEFVFYLLDLAPIDEDIEPTFCYC